jgi:hypothetical protein
MTRDQAMLACREEPRAAALMKCCLLPLSPKARAKRGIFGWRRGIAGANMGPTHTRVRAMMKMESLAKSGCQRMPKDRNKQKTRISTGLEAGFWMLLDFLGLVGGIGGVE